VTFDHKVEGVSNIVDLDCCGKHHTYHIGYGSVFDSTTDDVERGSYGFAGGLATNFANSACV